MVSLSAQLRDSGYSLVQNSAGADIIIINTCSVTGGTESKVKRLIKSIARTSPKCKILVTGCLAQQNPGDLMDRAGVCWVVGTSYKDEIVRILEDGRQGVFCAELTKDNTPVALYDSCCYNPEQDLRTRFHLKIQEGCDYRCSFCIVPVLRGPSRSVPANEIKRICKQALDAGCKEIVLTGTHIGQYADGKDYTLVQLIDDIVCYNHDFRLRLSSLDPRDCTDEILQRIGDEERICAHIHLSVQSFSPEVLEGMNRRYRDYDMLIERLDSFRKKWPHAAIGGDFIVGFPGETESMFETTLHMVRNLGFSYGHVFRYSRRPHTVASERGGQISEKEKTERSDRLRECLVELRCKFIENQIDKVTHRIIVEQQNPAKGVTSNYIRVVVPQTFAKRNTWQEVRLKKYIPAENVCESCLL